MDILPPPKRMNPLGKAIPKAICGMCVEDVDGQEWMVVPKEEVLRNRALENIPGNKHGRVHRECAYAQLFLFYLDRWGGRLRRSTFHQLTKAMQEVEKRPFANPEFNRATT